jgi:predicted SAM-dependent methyltransferase
MIKVNIGCGTTTAPDWINIDNSATLAISKHNTLKKILAKFGIIDKSILTVDIQNVKRYNVTKGLPFKNNTVDFIFTSHFLEHLPRDKAKEFILESKRVLKPNGIIRISVPDLKNYATRYLTEKIDADNFLEYMHFFEERQNRTLAEKFYLRILGTDRHKWMYDRQSLTKLLNGAGFVDVNECKFKEGKVPDLDKLDIRPNDSLFVEARKSN